MPMACSGCDGGRRRPSRRRAASGHCGRCCRRRWTRWRPRPAVSSGTLRVCELYRMELLELWVSGFASETENPAVQCQNRGGHSSYEIV